MHESREWLAKRQARTRTKLGVKTAVRCPLARHVGRPKGFGAAKLHRLILLPAKSANRAAMASSSLNPGNWILSRAEFLILNERPRGQGQRKANAAKLHKLTGQVLLAGISPDFMKKTIYLAGDANAPQANQHVHKTTCVDWLRP